MGNKKIVSEALIIKAAEEMISKSETGEIDMRGLAKHLNIAVGTLYNYYKSREALLEAVFYSSWGHTIDKIEEALEHQNDLKAGMVDFFEILSSDIKNREQLGRKMLTVSIKKGDNYKVFEGIVDEIIKKMNVFITANVVEKDHGMRVTSRSRWIFMMFFSSILMDKGLNDTEINETIDFYLR